MRILFLTQFYPPEIGAAQNRLSHLAKSLARAGHAITVLTALPNYPRGAIYEEYRGHCAMEEQESGIRIVRAWVYATASKGFVPRVMSYLSFSFTSLLTGILKIPRQDIVLVESPPLPLGMTGVVLSRLKRARLALNVSDLWPESAVALGALRNRFAIRASIWLEEYLYRNARWVTGQTRGIVGNIQSRFRAKPVYWIPNGVDTAVFTPDESGEKKRRGRELLNIDGRARFIAGYAGLIGLAQDLETVLRAAAMLDDIPELSIVLIGDGPELSRLKQLTTEMHLQNVRFCDAQPASAMPDILAAFDAALVPLKRLTLFKGALPSKMFEAMGAGVPVVCTVDGEAREIVEQSGGGLYVDPEDPKALAGAIARLCREPALSKALGENARRYVSRHFSRERAARQFEAIFSQECRAEEGPASAADEHA